MWREHWTNSIIFVESKTPSNIRLLALSPSWLDLGLERGVPVLGAGARSSESGSNPGFGAVCLRTSPWTSQMAGGAGRMR